MSVVSLTSKDFEKTITDNPIVLVDFWAQWCGPCRQFAPIFEKAAEANPNIVFGKVDTDEQGELAQMAQITSIPTLMAFKGGKMVHRSSGALPAAALADLIKQVEEFEVPADDK